MITVLSLKPVLACLVSALAIGPILWFRNRPNWREACTLVAAFIKFGLVLSMLPAVTEGKILEFTIWPLMPEMPLRFRVDSFGLLFALVASSLWIVTTIFSIGYMRGLNEHAQTRFYVCFALALSATIGVAFSANLITLYLFYEALSLSTFPLVTHHQDREARTGGRTYLTYLLGTSIAFVLPAMIYCSIKAGGTPDFSSAGFLQGHIGATEAIVVLLLLVFGFAKAGLMPFHAWLPGAMVAPTPVSALLHAVAVVKVGVFCILRIITGVFGVQWLQELNLGSIVAWIAAFTVVASSLVALSQDNLKRRLAYSTIGQLSYIILGAALLSPKSLTGSMMHIATHAFGKITLFFCAGAIFVATGKKYISEMAGLGKHMPITMTAFFIGSLSVIGLPPTGGLLSKLYLVWGTLETQQYSMTGVYLLSSLLNAIYFFPIVFAAFFRPSSQADAGIKEANAPCQLALCITAVVSILLFFYPGPVYSLANLMAHSLFNFQ